MQFTTWAYPWDLRDEGVDSAAARLQQCGVDEITLATNYHTVQAFTPRNPKRRTFFARSSAYFQPEEDYGVLEPVPYEGMAGDWLAEIAVELAETDISLSSWTIGCHNSRLGMENPEVTLETAHGDDLVFGLCPSQPAVQEYLCMLVHDLATRGIFERIELETFDYFYGTGFGWHHQKIHAELGILGEFLFGVCFCEHCRANAADAGVPVKSVRETVATTVDEIIAGDVPSTLSPERWVRAHPAVADYLAIRERTLESLYADLASAAGDTPIGSYVGMPEPGNEWLCGVDLKRLGTHVDYYCLPAYESSPDAVLEAYHTVEALTSDVPVHVGLLPGQPAVHDGETLETMVAALRSVDVPRVSFYNYGLLPEQSLDWIENAT